MACFWILICRSWLCVLNVTYCYEPTYGVSRSEIRSFLRCRYRRWFYFLRKKIHPALRSAHVGTGTDTCYTASVPLCYRYCKSHHPHRFMRIRGRDAFRKKQLCRSWRPECLFDLILLLIVFVAFARTSWLKTRIILLLGIFMHNLFGFCTVLDPAGFFLSKNISPPDPHASASILFVRIAIRHRINTDFLLISVWFFMLPPPPPSLRMRVLVWDMLRKGIYSCMFVV
jgi:hypothetical protein